MTTQSIEKATPPPYEPEPLVRLAASEIRALRLYRELLLQLIRSALAAETRGTALGAVWWVLDPLILMGVYYLFVAVILDAAGDDYALFIFVGLTAWKHFSSSVMAGITGTLSREPLMRQVAFPRSVLPLATGIAGTLHFLIALGLFFVLSYAFGPGGSPVLVLVLVPIAIQVVLMLGVSFFLSAVNIFFRDVQNLAGYAFRLLLFLSPILYTIEQVPESVRSVYGLNPFAVILPAYHAILLRHELPDFTALAAVSGVALVSLVLGFLTFVHLQGHFTKAL